MSSKATFNFRPFITSMIMDATSNQTPVAWVKTSMYSIGDKISANGKNYIATNTGVSSTTAPFHSSGTAVDGTVSWLFMGTSKVAGMSSNLYLTLGGTTAWADENNPPEPDVSDIGSGAYRNDILTAIMLGSRNMRHGIKNIPWSNGKLFSAFDASINLDEIGAYANPFYCVNSNQDIYKCINNGGGKPSTFEPVGRDLGFIISNTTDGHIWKYMGSVNITDITPFATPDYIPVSVKMFDDGSEQWRVQQAARAGSLSSFTDIVQVGLFETGRALTTTIYGAGSGAIATTTTQVTGQIDQIVLSNGGEGYGNNTFATVKYSNELGSGAVLKAVLTDGKITDVTLENVGTDYDNVSIFVVGDGTGASLSASINSVNGSISSVQIDNQGTGYTYANIFVVAGEHNAIATAILAPANGHGANIVIELASDTLLISSRQNASMRPYLLEGDASRFRQFMLISGLQGKTSVNNELMIGSKHPQYGSGTLYELNTARGIVVYVDNFSPITRAVNQEEYVKIEITI